MKKNLYAICLTFICLCLPFGIFAQNADSDFDGTVSGGAVLTENTDFMFLLESYYMQWYGPSVFPATPATWYHHPAAIVGDVLYVQNVAGVTGSAISTYNLGAGNGGGSWGTGVSLPASLVGGDMVPCAGKIYYIGGDPSTITGTGSNNVFEFDPLAGSWSAKAAMPASLSGHGAVCWGDSVIFVIGGPWATAGNDRNVYYYRPATNTWGTISNSLPAGSSRRTFSIGISGNKIMMAAGYKSGTFLKSAYIGTIGSDATQITWAQAANVPTPYTGLSRLGGEAIGDFFFTVGGEKGGPGGYSDTTFVFKFSSNAWLPTASAKQTGISNIFNSVTAKMFTGDTIKLFVPSGYAGSGITNTNFEVMKFKVNSGVGIEYIDETPVYTVYPNPTDGIMTVELSKVNEAAASLSSLSGQAIQSYMFSKGLNKIDLSSLPKGIYYLTISGDKLLKTEKIVLY